MHESEEMNAHSLCLKNRNKRIEKYSLLIWQALLNLYKKGFIFHSLFLLYHAACLCVYLKNQRQRVLFKLHHCP